MPPCTPDLPRRAPVARALAVLALAALAAGCGSPHADVPHAAAATAKAGPPTREAAEGLTHTATSEIRFGDELVGYLLDVLPVPAGVVDDRPWEPGTAMIQDLRFRFIGFISPRGTTYRFDEHGTPHKVGFGSRSAGIAAFFMRNGEPTLVSLHPGAAPES
jgi:hypothetical protein